MKLEPCLLSELTGKTFTCVENLGDELRFNAPGGSFVLYHERDCCESVSIEDVDGDLGVLGGSPILVAEEVDNEPLPEDTGAESETWTFYKFATVKGSVTVRWYGTSNGYYSESVSFARIVGDA